MCEHINIWAIKLNCSIINSTHYGISYPTSLFNYAVEEIGYKHKNLCMYIILTPSNHSIETNV